MARVVVRLVQVVATLALAEGLIRIVNPAPRIQVVRHDRGVTIDTRHGVPVWTHTDSTARTNTSCTEAPHDGVILLMGDSITFGAGLDAEESVGVQLQHLLDANLPEQRLCVVNLAQPGSVFVSQDAMLRDAVETLQPMAVYWQLFYGSPNRPVVLGDAVFVLQGPAAHATPPRLVPDPLHGWLFAHAHLYQYASLALIPGRSLPDWEALLTQELPAATAHLAHRGIATTMVLAPKLDRPFGEHRTDPWPTYTELLGHADAHDLPVLNLAEAFEDQDVEALRRNTCCHYNPAGHRAYAQVLFDHLRERELIPSAD